MAQDGGRRAGGVAGCGVRRGEVVIDVGGHGVVGVALVGDAPVDEEDVVAALQQSLDEAVARPQVPDVAAVDQAGHEQHRRSARHGPGPVPAQGRPVLAPHDQVRSAAGVRAVEAADEAQPIGRPAQGAAEIGPQAGQGRGK